MTQTYETRPDHVAQGIGLILVSVAMMAFADAVVKLVSANLTVWQIFAARSLFGIPLLIALAQARTNTLRPRAATWTFIRSALLVLTWFAFYAALPVLDLSVTAVAVYTSPILIALLSAMFLGERIAGRQWGGVMLGFLGVVAILKPGTEDFSWFVLLPLLAAAFYALAMVVTRSKCQNEAPLALALALHSLFLATGLIATIILALTGLGAETKAAYPFLLGDWGSMGWREWGLMSMLGALSAGYFIGVARAYQVAPPQIIATFDYAYLVWAALWGFVLFAEKPDSLTVLGMILVSAAGLMVATPSAKTAVKAKAGAN